MNDWKWSLISLFAALKWTCRVEKLVVGVIRVSVDYSCWSWGHEVKILVPFSSFSAKNHKHVHPLLVPAVFLFRWRSAERRQKPVRAAGLVLKWNIPSIDSKHWPIFTSPLWTACFSLLMHQYRKRFKATEGFYRFRGK